MIGFVGLSHLGIVSSLAAASKGSRVVAYDPRDVWVSELKKGRLPLAEPELDQALKAHQAQVQFTSNLKELEACDIVYFSIDIRTDDDGQSDLSELSELIQTAIPHLKTGTVLVVLSQVTPGFTRRLLKKIQVERFPLFYQVETLIFGQAWARATKPERIMVGAGDPKQVLPKKYQQFLDVFSCPILMMRYESAELAKISINLCLAASLSVANTMAEICEAIGADWSEIVPALRMDKRIGPHSYLNPGLGIGGGNLERDLVTVKKLSSEWGTDAGIADAFLNNSRYRRDWVLRVLHERLLSKSLKPSLAIWGLAYKPATDSIKNSPALALIKSLGQISLRVYDPQAVLPADVLPNIKQAESAMDTCRDADALVVMTAWEEFSKIEIKTLKTRMKGSLIIDPWGVLNPSDAAAHGFSYHRLGAVLETQGDS